MKTIAPVLLLTGCDGDIKQETQLLGDFTNPKRSEYILTKPNGCSLQLYVNDNTQSVQVMRYTCRELYQLSMDFAEDISRVINHFDLKKINDEFPLVFGIKAGGIRFPELLRRINDDEIWPVDFMQKLEADEKTAYQDDMSLNQVKADYWATVKRGEGIEHHGTVDEYVALMRRVAARELLSDEAERVIIRSRYLENLSDVFFKVGCNNPRRDDGFSKPYFLTKVDDHGDEFYETDYLVKAGLFEPSEITKNNYPEIDSMMISCD